VGVGGLLTYWGAGLAADHALDGAVSEGPHPCTRRVNVGGHDSLYCTLVQCGVSGGAGARQSSIADIAVAEMKVTCAGGGGVLAH
jgi:hypothetical protein